MLNQETYRTVLQPVTHTLYTIVSSIILNIIATDFRTNVSSIYMSVSYEEFRKSGKKLEKVRKSGKKLFI